MCTLPKTTMTKKFPVSHCSLFGKKMINILIWFQPTQLMLSYINSKSVYKRQKDILVLIQISD